MKMAKASNADLNMAMELSNFLESVERGHIPDSISLDDEDIEFLSIDNGEQCCRIVDALRRILNKGSICRVVFGMAVVCDPSNKLLDPNADTLEHHPERKNAEAALLWTLYHHQGGSSPIGQPIRKLLGIGQHDRLTDEQLTQAKSFAGIEGGGS